MFSQELIIIIILNQRVIIQLSLEASASAPQNKEMEKRK